MDGNLLISALVWLLVLSSYISSPHSTDEDQALVALQFLNQLYKEWTSEPLSSVEQQPPAIFLALRTYVEPQIQEKVHYSYRVLLELQHSQNEDQVKSFLHTSVMNLDHYLKASGTPSPLLTAIINNDLKAVTFLLDSFHFDVNLVDEFGWTGLHLAAWLDLDQMALLLLSKGADPYIVTLEGFTSLHIAAMRGFEVIGRVILHHLKGEDRDVCGFMNVKTKQRYRKGAKLHGKGSKLNAFEVALLPPVKNLFMHMFREFVNRECHDDLITPSLDIEPYCSTDESGRLSSRREEISCLSTTGFRSAYVRSSPSSSKSAIDVWDAADLTPSIFKNDYYSLQRPVLIRGNLSSHMGTWKYLHGSIDNFNNRYGNIITKTGEIPYAESYGGPPRISEPIAAYVRQHFRDDEDMFEDLNGEETPLLRSDWRDAVAHISFDGSFFKDQFKEHLLLEDFEAPSLFANVCGDRDEDKLRPYVGIHQLSIGPSGSGAPLHSHVAAWNVVLRGTKKWLLFPPGHLRDLDSSFRRSNATNLGYTVFRISQGWGLNKKINPEIAKFALENGLAFEVVQQPGDVLMIPSQYGHGTLNLCGTISIAQEFGCLDDHVFNGKRLLTLPVMQPYLPIFERKSGYTHPAPLKI